MPPENRIGAANRIGFYTVICLVCAEPVGVRRQAKGKAMCGRCERAVRNAKPLGVRRVCVKREGS